MNLKVEALRQYAKDHSVEDVAELARKLLGMDAEFGWKTNSNGKHYKVGKGGNVTAGPKAMVGKNVNNERSKPSYREPRSKRPFNSHGRASNVTKCRDITQEFVNRSTPGKGRFRISPGVVEKDRDEDIEMAKWLHKKFGGDMIVLAESHEEVGKKNPDFLWRGKLWDLKTPDQRTFNALNKRTQSGIRQIRPNPGGIIMDLNKCGATLQEAEKAVRNRMFTSADFEADVVILHKGKEFKVLHFE